MDYYEKRKASFEKGCCPNPHSNLLTPNGVFHERQIVNKAEFLNRFITKSGNILDLGCGNGLLLKELKKLSEFELVPHGVDFVKNSIKQAKEIVLPGYAINFILENVMNFDFKKEFQYIIADPESVSDNDIGVFINKCYKTLSHGGKLIFFIPSDVMLRIKKRPAILRCLKNARLEWFQDNDLYCGIKTKPLIADNNNNNRF